MWLRRLRSEKRRVLQIQTQAEAGGAQRVSDALARGLRARGYTVTTAYLYRKTDAYDGDDYATFMLDKPPGKHGDFVLSLVRLVRFARSFRPEAIISFQHYGNLAGTIAKLATGCRCLVANQNGMPGGVGIPVAAMMADRILGGCGFYTANVVNSEVTRAAFAAYPAKYRASITKIDHGVERLRQDLSRGLVRARYGLPADAPIMASAGRLVEQKQHLALVHVLAELEEVHCVIAGTGPLSDHLKDMAIKLGVASRLHLVGEVDPIDMGNFLRCADVFAFPSLWETFGLAVVEAGISGIPIVCNDIPILREVLSVDCEDMPVIFADAREPKEFARAIHGSLYMSCPSQALERFSSKLGKRYSIDEMINSYEKLLQYNGLS